MACGCKKTKSEITKAREEQRARRAAYREARAEKQTTTKETAKSG